MATKAYSYIRWSSARQSLGGSLTRQLSAAEAYAAEYGLDLDTSLRDPGVSAYSGTNREKGDLSRFLRMVDDGQIEPGSYLLVDSMDRLSRLPLNQAAAHLLALANAGIKVVTINDRMVFDSGVDLTTMIQAVLKIQAAHDYSRELGRKVAAGHANRKRQARETGRVWHSYGPGWLQFDPLNRKFVPILDRVAIVERMVDMTLNLGMGCRTICKRFTAEGVPTFVRLDDLGQPKGRITQWQDTTVIKILRSRALIGEYQPRFRDGSPDGDPIPGYFPEVIDPVLFHRVQASLDRNKGRPGRRQGGQPSSEVEELRNLLAGVAKCGSCGGTMRLHRRSKDKVDLYQCYTMEFDGCGNRTRVKVKPLEEAILSHITEWDLTSRAEINSAERSLIIAVADRDELAAKLRRLAVLRLAEEADPTLRDLYAEMAADLAIKDRAIADLKAQMEQSAVALGPESHQGAIRKLRDQLATLEGPELYDARSRLAVALKAVIDRVEFNSQGGVHVRVLGGAHLYYFDAAMNLTADFNLVHPTRPISEAFSGGDPGRKAMLERLRPG